MPKPTDPVSTWATDANYTPAGKPWDGTPTKVAPAGGYASQGHAPTSAPPAQSENHFKNNHGTWLGYVAGLLTTPDWVWIHGATLTPSGGSTPAVGATAGLFGAAASTTQGFAAIKVPSGFRIVGVGLKIKHDPAEATNVGTAACEVFLVRSQGAVQGNNNVEDIPSTPVQPVSPTATVVITSLAGGGFETKTAVVDSTGDKNLADGNYTFLLALALTNQVRVEAVGYQLAAV